MERSMSDPGLQDVYVVLRGRESEDGDYTDADAPG